LIQKQLQQYKIIISAFIVKEIGSGTQNIGTSTKLH